MQTLSESKRLADGAERAGPLGRFGLIAGLVAICGATAWARASALNPGSLWNDDAWVALIKKVGWHDGVLAAARSAPIGFSLLTKLVLNSVSDVELGAQALPFLAGLACIVLFALLVLRVFGSRWLALLGAALMAIAPAIAMYSVRVKQYTLESASVIVLLWLFWELIAGSERRLRALLRLLVASVALLAFGHGIIFVAFVLLHLGAAWLWRTRKAGERLLPAFTICLVFDGLLAAYYALVLRRQHSDGLEHFWIHRNAFAPLGQPLPAWLYFLRNSVWGKFFAGALPSGSPAIFMLCALLLGLGLVALLIGRERRMLGVAILLLYLQSLALSALRLYPMGGYRLDIYLHPAHLLLVVSGVWFLLGGLRESPIASLSLRSLQRWLPGLMALGLCVRFLPGFIAPPLGYHRGTGAVRLIEALERDVHDGDGVIVDGKFGFVFALDTHWDVHVSGRATNGLSITYDRPDLIFLRDRIDAALQQNLEQLLAHGYARIFYLSISGSKPIREVVFRTLQDGGYRIASKRNDDGGSLFGFVARKSLGESAKRGQIPVDSSALPPTAAK